MRAVRYHEHGGPAVLRVDDVDGLTPGHGDVLLEVHAASLNPVDTLYMRGVLGADSGGAFADSGLPSTVGTDVAGIVRAVGPGVTAFDTGDRVFGTGMADSDRATVAETAVAPADHLARLPEGVAFVDAAAAAHVGGTAWRAIVEFGSAGPAQSVLIHGGSGGVGHLAVQLASLSGADVVATAGSERARAAVADFGADTVLDYNREDLADAIRHAVGPVDLVLDSHTGEYLELDIEVAANGGCIAHINGAFPEMPHPNGTRTKELTIQGVAMHNTPDIGAVMSNLATLLADGDLRPHVERTFDLDETADAYRALAEEHVVGKLVVTP